MNAITVLVEHPFATALLVLCVAIFIGHLFARRAALAKARGE